MSSQNSSRLLLSMSDEFRVDLEWIKSKKFVFLGLNQPVIDEARYSELYKRAEYRCESDQIYPNYTKYNIWSFL